MTLTLEVRGAQASALGTSARQRFGPRGGVIGRAAACDWVLPHAKVSARHAIIRFIDGVYYVEDKSRNGVFVNQRRERLAAGQPHPLQSGDLLFIDPYDIKVSISTGTSAIPSRIASEEVEPFPRSNRPADAGVDPFGDPFAPDEGDDEGVAPDLGVSRDASRDRELDPLNLIDAATSAPPAAPRPSAKDPESASVMQSHYAPPAIRDAPAQAGPGPIEIPEGYNPMDDSGIVAIAPRTPSADSLGEPDVSTPIPSERPRAAVPSLAPSPTPVPVPTVREAVEEAGPADEAAPAAPEGLTPGLDARSPAEDVVPDVVAAEAAAEPSSPSAPPTPPVGIEVVPSSTPPAEKKGSNAVNLAAVLEGAGLANVEVSDQLARDFGRILAVVVGGVMDVLRARQELKDEFRMRMTQFRPADNNPLKFSANVEDALHNLLVKRNAAYLQPVDAFEDAFDDLRGHQLAMLEGMQAAFEAMLGEFNPDRLQEKFDRQLKKKGALLTVPAKLRYWELYRDHCEDLLKDTEATFKKLFGQTFAEAYEERLNRLKGERRVRRRDA